MPEPLAYNPIGTPFIELLSVDSTNNYALTQVHAGLAQHGTAFFAHEQVAGKGQRGKSWTAQKDSSLIISIVVNPYPLHLTQQFQLSACVAVTACEFFRKYAGTGVRIKWPNDLYWCDRKAGGILIENIIGGRNRGTESQHPMAIGSKDESQATEWRWAVVGIGVNMNQAHFPDELKNPVSLKQITGKDFDTVVLAKELCSLMDTNFKKLISEGFNDFYGSYLSNLYKLDEPVRLKKDNRIFEAVIKSVSPTGELIVQHTIEESFNFGDIEWVLPAGKSKK